MVDEILALGFDSIELDYGFRRELAEGVQRRVEARAVRVCSVHSFCPVPMGVSRGHPELWTLAHGDPMIRKKAVEQLRITAEFAASMGAETMVVHGGSVDMRALTPRLIRLMEQGREGSWWWNWSWNALERRRTRAAPAALRRLRGGLDALLPALEKCRVRLALENLPYLEAVPSEHETLELLRAYDSPWLGAWHDFGHGQIRENLGFANPARMLELQSPYLAGFHVHDVIAPATDHQPPGKGMVDFERFSNLVREQRKLPRVFEPLRDAPAEDLRAGLTLLKKIWT